MHSSRRWGIGQAEPSAQHLSRCELCSSPTPLQQQSAGLGNLAAAERSAQGCRADRSAHQQRRRGLHLGRQQLRLVDAALLQQLLRAAAHQVRAVEVRSAALRQEPRRIQDTELWRSQASGMRWASKCTRAVPGLSQGR